MTDTKVQTDEVDKDERDVKQIRADIEELRRELGDTVEALSAKVDVKARAQDAWADMKSRFATGPGETARPIASRMGPFAMIAGGIAVAVTLLIVGRKVTE